MNVILHITRQDQWEQAQVAGIYRGDTLASEGFIHCSTPAQVVRVANARFLGANGLVLLCIAPDRVQPAIKYEASAGDERFPHIYGPLNLDAVVAVLAFEPQTDGSFTLPSGVV